MVGHSEELESEESGDELEDEEPSDSEVPPSDWDEHSAGEEASDSEEDPRSRVPAKVHQPFNRLAFLFVHDVHTFVCLAFANGHAGATVAALAHEPCCLSLPLSLQTQQSRLRV